MFARPPAAVVFDMDGVLFDTERLYEEAALAAATEFGIEMTSEFFRSTVGSPWPVNRIRLLDHFGPSLAVDELGAAAGRIFLELLEARKVLKPGVIEILGVLDELRLPRAIATSSPRHRVESHLARYGLSGRFDRIVLFVDDTPANVQTAKSVGWRAFLHREPEDLRRAIDAVLLEMRTSGRIQR